MKHFYNFKLCLLLSLCAFIGLFECKAFLLKGILSILAVMHGHVLLFTGLLCLGFVYKFKNRIRKSIHRLSKKMLKMLGLSISEDFIFLNTGSHEIRVDLGCDTPISVWVTFEDQCGVPVCQGSIDKVGVELGDTFFVLYADIVSESRAIRWFAVLN